MCFPPLTPPSQYTVETTEWTLSNEKFQIEVKDSNGSVVPPVGIGKATVPMGEPLVRCHRRR